MDSQHQEPSRLATLVQRDWQYRCFPRRRRPTRDGQPRCPLSKGHHGTAPESTYYRAAIPPVVPWLHIKREHHPIRDGHVGSPHVGRRWVWPIFPRPAATTFPRLGRWTIGWSVKGTF